MAAEPTILTVTNAEKLALTGIEVGQQVSVSDGFYVSGTNTEADDFFIQNGTQGGKSKYYPLSSLTNLQIGWNPASSPPKWKIDDDNDDYYTSEDDAAEPWLVTSWAAGPIGDQPPTLTHPALQQYTGIDPSDEANWEAVP